MREFDIIIIGGGASGLMAANSTLNSNKKVLIIEKNEKLGKKIYITGKGRCNVTNNCDIEDFFINITRNHEFMYSSLYSYSNVMTKEFFELNGVPLKVERGNRVFPKSDKASDIINALEKPLINKVTINLNEKVFNIEKVENKFKINTSKDSYITASLIIATGGMSYPGTGSTGDGYNFAKKFNHKIIDIKPSLCPIILKGNKWPNLAGLTVKNAQITLFINDKKYRDYFGDFLFTHKGISGPIVLTMSDDISNLNSNDKIELLCDFKPAIEFEKLENRFLEDINNNPKKQISNIISNYFPISLGEFLLKSIGIDLNTKLHEINKEDRKKIINMMKKYKFEYIRLDHIRQAIITKGGVDTLEVDTYTMESKLVENLYFCGEILDVNALTGGFNLQIAFSTGYMAGKSASEK